MNKTFFTADTHFSHDNIRKYCNRPFDTAEEMNEVMIERWNSVVKQGDLIYHLGDFSWGDPIPILEQLNGQVYYIIGNHDKRNYRVLQEHQKIVWMKDLFTLKHDGKSTTLCHYAMYRWPKAHFNEWHLFGHTHGTLAGVGKSFDVGVDANDFTPLSWEQVVEKMKGLPDNSGLVERG